MPFSETPKPGCWSRPPKATSKAKLSPEQVLELMRALSTEQLEALRAVVRPKEPPPAQGP